jgi:isopenicillin N synthase-like dioxygenase
VTVEPMAFQRIPVIGLDGLDPDELCRICHEVGFFQLVDHGVDLDVIDDYFEALRAFFALPVEAKESIEKIRSPWFRGWERLGSELTDHAVDHREQVDVWTAHPPHDRSVEPIHLRLEGPNQWPAESVLPGFRAIVERFQAEMGSVADRLMAAMCTGLGLDPGHLDAIFGERRMSLIKMIRYPRTPAGGAGVNPHHDAGFLTLLWQRDVAGLQALNPDGTWIDVPPSREAICVNLGEILQSMTGNYFVATTHRVVSPSERISSGYFHGPDLRTRLDPLPLDPRFTETVAASPRHRDAGFMATRDELLGGERGIRSTGTSTFGEQLWNYFCRSYPDLVARHHPDVVL